jgi:acyl-coenzyme A synthetase/AMP-(fatty) acid ligase
MPIPSRNLGSCFGIAVTPDKTAIIDVRDWENPVELTYRAFDAECNAVARGLLKQRLKRGDRIGILSLNRFEALAAFFGTMRAGLVAVPISFKLSRETVEYIVRDAGLKAVFHDGERSDLAPPGLLRIGFDDAGGYGALKDPGSFETVEPQGREIGMMLYTSGSTGRPKGVLLSHESQLWGAARSLTLIDNPSQHRYVVAAPMFHMNATFSVKLALASGASMVLMPSFNAEIYARVIERFRVTWLTSVPTMLALIAREVAFSARSTSPRSNV